MSDERRPPDGWAWYDLGRSWPPQSVPREVDGPLPTRTTLLVGPDGKTPILQRAPRAVGFRPPKEIR